MRKMAANGGPGVVVVPVRSCCGGERLSSTVKYGANGCKTSWRGSCRQEGRAHSWFPCNK